ncbi:MAG TPA: FCD domain-containing protein [Candidatus Binatia bacterium]|jgi:DNA-binding FadR family transcriptional regulator|nr:FCD domain-containing protein [Candidatus Binatia bacterium]
MRKIEPEFLNYIIEQKISPGARLPTLAEMSAEIGISLGKLREQLEVARSRGLVSVKPRVGTQREPFSFLPVTRDSVLFGLASGEAEFEHFSELRQAIESGLWIPAVTRLKAEDHELLRNLIARAWDKLYGDPVLIPNKEHRLLHLTIFNRLDNPFVKGILEAYWDIYEAVELTRLASYEYWLEVWEYHEKMVETICNGEFLRGQQLLLEHFELLPRVRPSVWRDGERTA